MNEEQNEIWQLAKETKWVNEIIKFLLNFLLVFFLELLLRVKNWFSSGEIKSSNWKYDIRSSSLNNFFSNQHIRFIQQM